MLFHFIISKGQLININHLSLISSGLKYQDGDARFTMVRLKALSEKL